MAAQRVGAMGAMLVLGLLLGAPAWSNGDMFFEAMEIPGKPEYVIFGNVKDVDGKRIAGAFITIKISEPRLSYTAETDVIGRFRTLDIGRAIRGLGYDVDPTKIAIDVEYPEHKVARRAYRGKRGQDKGAVEIDFVIEKKVKS